MKNKVGVSIIVFASIIAILGIGSCATAQRHERLKQWCERTCPEGSKATSGAIEAESSVLFICRCSVPDALLDHESDDSPGFDGKKQDRTGYEPLPYYPPQ